ncbi:MAG: hypothetical protein GF372_12615, partial [Candidatus Marinimicrobia bacterium]|nr:hypothetical protein [Candidatus Neomarinimicrobiota bacterium]
MNAFRWFALLIGIIFICGHIGIAQTIETKNPVNLSLGENQNRSYLLTDNDNSYWIGESHKYNLKSHLGLTFRQQPVFKDLFVFINGDLLSRDEARAIISPSGIQRYYPDYGITERVYLLEKKGTLVSEFITDSSYNVILVPAFYSSTSESDITTEPSDGLHKIIQPAYRTQAGLPLSAHLEVEGDGQWYPEDSRLTWQIPTSLDLDHPIQWIGEIGDTLRVFYSLSGDRGEHENLTLNWRENISGVGNSAQFITTDSPRLNKSLGWSFAHLEKLKMTQNETGIFAGLPGRDYYSARESFLGLTGAALIQGEYDFARRLLRRFAEFQVSDRTDSAYGQIPSRLNLGYPTYDSADAAALFTFALFEYLKYSGEFVLLRELFPVIKESIEGTLQYRVDADFLMIHEQSATWMDAVGPAGAWSPRGNHAVEVQMMWHRQLQIGIRLAEELGDSELASRWRSAADQVAESIRDTFWLPAEQNLADHVNSDSSVDRSLRPNGLLGLYVVPELFSPDQRAEILRNVLSENTYSWGVSSLSQTDQNFFPYLNVPRYDSVNPAKHNGMIYPWLTGPVVSELMRFNRRDLAEALNNFLTEKILSSDFAGGIPEFTDAMQKNNWRTTSVSNPPDQHGSGIDMLAHAEYIRNWYQDYLGIVPDGFENELTMAPRLPDGVNEASSRIYFSGNRVDIRYAKTGDKIRIDLKNDGNPFTVKFEFRVGDSLYVLQQPFQLAAIPDFVSFFFDAERKTYMFNGRDVPTEVVSAHYSQILLEDAAFQQPELSAGLRSLQQPAYPLLRAGEVALLDTSLRAIVDVPDPVGDDYGPAGSYTYPQHGFFADGIFDMTNFRVRTDESHIYFELDFRELVQPGWHPEYGFQLTYAAIGIHTGDEEVGAWQFGKNAKHRADAEIPMQYIIYIGGGIRVESHTGEIVAEYRPKPDDQPLADLESNQIRFAIPMEYIPQPKRWWQYTVITGGQDDHNGGGIGEFREIKQN